MTASKASERSVRVGLILTTTLVAILSACNHQSLDVGPDPVPADFISYLQSGEIGVFHQRDLLRLSGDLQQETGRVTFDDLPPDANVVAARLSADGRVAVLAWSSDPRWATYPDNGVSTALTVEAFRLLPYPQRIFQLPLPNLDSMELSRAGDLLAVHVPQANLGPGAWGFQIYDVASGAPLWSSSDIGPPFALSPDGGLVYSNVISGGLGSWDSHTGALQFQTPIDESPGGGYYLSLAVSPDAATVIGSGSLDALPPSYDVFARFTYRRASDGQLEKTFPQDPWFDQAWTLAISPADGRWAAVTQNVAGDLTPMIQVRDAGGTVLYALPASFDSQLAFSPDGQNLAATIGGALSVHRVADGTPIVARGL